VSSQNLQEEHAAAAQLCDWQQALCLAVLSSCLGGHTEQHLVVPAQSFFSLRLA